MTQQEIETDKHHSGFIIFIAICCCVVVGIVMMIAWWALSHLPREVLAFLLVLAMFYIYWITFKNIEE